MNETGVVEQVAVIGLGYVGLPLAMALARHQPEDQPVVGFDIDTGRIAELVAGHDRTGEIAGEVLKGARIRFTADPAALPGRTIYIITVPTPVDEANQPDLGPLRSACAVVGAALVCGTSKEATPLVVFESTVYPGVTEEVCGPALAEASGLAAGRDFLLGYSPERINPGDREHTVDRITKVVAGQTPEVTAKLAEVYGAVTTGGVFADCDTAENRGVAADCGAPADMRGFALPILGALHGAVVVG